MTDPQYQRCTIAFVDPAGRVLGSEYIDVQPERLADPEFVAWAQQDQLARRGPSSVSGARAVLLLGQLSDAQCCAALSKPTKEG